MAFNLENYQEQIGINGLVEAVAAGENVQAVQKVSIAMRMAALAGGNNIPANGDDPAANLVLVARRNARLNYGPGSNARFVGTFMHEDPMLSQFVVASCNAGLFAGEIRHPLASVMVQLLTYCRYLMEDTFARGNVERQAQFQSYAMAELMGVHIPAERRCNQADARDIIVNAVNFGLNEEAFLDELGDDWFNPLIGPWDHFDDVEVTNIQEALAILVAWASTIETSKKWLSNMNLFLNVITALSKRGNVSEDAQTKIQEGVGEDLGTRHVYVNPASCQRYFKSFGKWINADNAQALFAHYRALVPEWSMRMSLTIQQAAGAGLTVYFIIVRAMTMNPDFNWPRVYKLLTGECAAYRVAANLVQNNEFYGFSQDLGLARSTNYPSLGYVCQQLCIKANGDNRLGRYGGLKTGIKVKDALDAMVEAYVNRKANAAMDEEETALNLAQINLIREALDLQPIVV